MSGVFKPVAAEKFGVSLPVDYVPITVVVNEMD